MKIFFVARGWPSEREPQWGSFECDQALALSKLGHQIVILSVDSHFCTYYRKFGVTHIEKDNISIYNFYAGWIWGKILQKLFFRLHLKVKEFFFSLLFNKVVKREGMPDLIYAHYLGNSSMALCAKRKYGIPVVAIEHWSELGYNHIKAPIKMTANKVYKEVDKLLVVSSYLRDNIIKNFGVDSIVVNNMIGSEFHYVPVVKKDKIVRFVATGNLIMRKGFDILISAFGKLNLPVNTWSLVIVGGGREYDNLLKMIDGFNLKHNIYLIGRKDRNEVVKTLHNSDIYILPSRSETFGVAAVEALACGLPVIATECGGSSDYMNDKNGLTCPVDDINSLSESILYMFNHLDDYDREQISKDCLNKFSSTVIAEQLNDIFCRVINHESITE